jgi:Raf kinase inhibitor-like YbhB/YbcL family protein
MSFIGRMLRGVRAGEGGLLWNSDAGRAAPASIELVSDAFEGGTSIPRRHAGKGVGENMSPPLAWKHIPRDTAELALVIEDADAPLPRPFVHTVVTAIPPEVTKIPEGVLVEGLEHPGVFGKGTGGGRGYRGPKPVPSHGPHTYVFQVFALAAPLPGARASLSRGQLEKAMAGIVLARGRLDGTYER